MSGILAVCLRFYLRGSCGGFKGRGGMIWGLKLEGGSDCCAIRGMREYDTFTDWEMDPFYIFSEVIGGIHKQKEMVTNQKTLQTRRTKGSSELV